MTALIVLFIASIWAGRAERARRRRLVHHASVADADRHGRARGQHHLDHGAVSRAARDRLHRARARRDPAGPDDADAILISLVGGAIGALILLATPPSVFARLVPWLVLFATALFAWGSFFRRSVDEVEGRLPPSGMGTIQFFIAVYGGYFGGGIGFMMMAALTMTGIAVRNAGALKNMLAGVMNASAVSIFVFSRDVHWLPALVTAVGASFGGWAGALMLKSVNERLLRLGVVAIGVALTIGLFWKA